MWSGKASTSKPGGENGLFLPAELYPHCEADSFNCFKIGNAYYQFLNKSLNFLSYLIIFTKIHMVKRQSNLQMYDRVMH